MRYRLAIPLIMASLFGGLALLWLAGPHSLYVTLLTASGIGVGNVPFLDLHAVTAAIECHGRGIDVYLANPCDILGRPHAYSPLWLDLAPGFLRDQDAAWLGAGLDLLIILSLPLVIRPRSLAETGVFLLATTSTMVVYALERANIDIVVFLLVVGAGALYRRPGLRGISYALCVIGACLKYYPLAGLILLVRERGRTLPLPLAGIAAGLAGFVLLYAGELRVALGNIPASASVYTDSFSARNLPAGIAELLSWSPGAGRLVAAAIFLLLLYSAAGRAWRMSRVLAAADEEAAPEPEATYLLLGATLLLFCFFASENIGYRGILFLLVLPGLMALRRAAEAQRRWLSTMIAAVLAVMWGEFLRRGLHAALAALAMPEWAMARVELLFWLGRELLWWWLAAGLAALVLDAVRRAPLTQDATALLQLWRGRAAIRR
ncbi:MAG TPA: hypothetical protein VJO12_16920 [Stellaceae bacterium]|nr:hypothetical protein [Stellaceae bacterium]